MKSTGYKFTARIILALGGAVFIVANSAPSRATHSSSQLQNAQKTTVAQADTLADAEKPAGIVLAQGKIKAIVKPPKPGSVPYKDAVIAIHLTEVEALDGTPLNKEVLVFMWGMRDNKWTTAAAFEPGQTVKLSLQPWDQVADQYGGYNRIELEGEDIFLLEPYWGEVQP